MLPLCLQSYITRTSLATATGLHVFTREEVVMSFRQLLQRYLPNLFPGGDDSTQVPTESTIMPVPVEVYESSEVASAPANNRRQHLITAAICCAPLVCWIIFSVSTSPAMGLIACLASIISVLLVLRRVRGPYQEHELSAKPTVPSSRVGRYLVKERLLREMRRHPISVLHWWVLLGLAQIGTLIGIVALGHAGVFGLIWLGLSGFTGWKLTDWWCNRMVVTNRRVLAVRGVFATSVPNMPLAKVTDLTHTEPFLSKVLVTLRITRHPYGRIVLESAGQKQGLEILNFVPDVSAVAKLMLDEALPHRDDGH